MLTTAPAPTRAQVVPIRPLPDGAPTMLCEPPCGRYLFEVVYGPRDRRLFHAAVCPECHDPVTGETLLRAGETCPTPEDHHAWCPRPEPVQCGHLGCVRAARVDAAPCGTHDHCCGGGCGCQDEG